ncbi:ABC transporter permease [Mesorhizobium ventifaucium]|uniref:Spermidine Putrescine ABC transporter permease component potB (TC_3.A.1.11.1) n=1 Tax=Mesorhizobium ventifaucium TaxID=666020 RepID=A0ABN8JG60_9HYPH|nr:ABC transporter permease [Mesorhizobium ventifaucium]CAH2396526.1 Spermidine Putrescine ABC transporter permease component potB (TC_3.A.1.11.1) [Mesorhizobium ventifaucium]
MAAVSRSALSKSLSRLRPASNTLVNLYFVLWFCLVIIPLLVLFSFSFFETKSFVTTYTPTLNTWLSLLDSGRLTVSLRTLRIALTVTLIEFLIAFPFALWLAKGGVAKSTQAIILALLTIPFFLDLSSRIIIWRSILSENGLISHLLVESGLTSGPVDWLLYNEWAVHFGMLVTYFPTMVLPIYMAISIIDDALIQASADLGASRKDTLLRIIVPLSLPGILAGVILTLGPALAAWIEPSMLGGGFVNLLSNSVESAYSALRYPVVAALSSFVMLMLAILVVALAILARRFGSLGAVFSTLRS